VTARTWAQNAEKQGHRVSVVIWGSRPSTRLSNIKR
jgi:hypothetical protein